MTTLLVAPAELDAGEITVMGDAYRHLFRARRLAVGDPLRLVDGEGRARAGRIEEVGRRKAAISVGEERPSLEPELRLELLVAPPRPQRAAWLVEKATELGVVAVRFIGAQRAVRQIGDGGIERLHRVARSAVEQCGRAFCPRVTGTHEWSELEALLASASRRIVLDVEQPSEPSSESSGKIPGADSDRVAILVGPEGGWTEAERAGLAALGCQPMGLGARVLRTETAALAAAARWLCR